MELDLKLVSSINKSGYFHGQWAKVSLLCIMMIVCLGCASTISLTSSNQKLNLTVLETELKRGVSTSADVERLLGKPVGVGSAVLPTLTSIDPQVVWFYDKIDFNILMNWQSERVTLDTRQNGALIFFQGNVLDGFMWFSDTGSEQ
jgi:hypothetical protein